jgi:hypothetical protein
MEEFNFSLLELEKNPKFLLEKDIQQVTISDAELSSDKNRFVKLIKLIEKQVPEVHFTFYISPSIIDKEIVENLSSIACTLQIDFLAEYLGEKRKFFSKKIRLLNDYGLVFGFNIDSANFPTIKSFKNALDEAINYYPNHIYINNEKLKPSEKLSTQDIKKIQELSFASEVFYSVGRAVPWFLAAIQPLRLRPSQFFQDFSEWQRCNNCSKDKNFVPEKVSHQEIEKMQLLFLKLKCEEKHLHSIFLPLKDLICLHGAFSRCVFEGEESTLELSYHPEDILSPIAMDLIKFTEEVCLENHNVKIFLSEFGPNYEIL